MLSLLLVPVLLLLLLSSCAAPAPMQSRAEAAAKLPVSRGENHGRFVARSPWQYRGSRPDRHEFRYYYHVGNDLRFRRVSLARDSVAFRDFEEVPLGGKPKWQSVVLAPQEAGGAEFCFRGW